MTTFASGLVFLELIQAEGQQHQKWRYTLNDKNLNFRQDLRITTRSKNSKVPGNINITQCTNWELLAAGNY